MGSLAEIRAYKPPAEERFPDTDNQLLLPAQTGIPNEVHTLRELGDLRFTYSNMPPAELRKSISVQLELTRTVDAWLTATSFILEQNNPLRQEAATDEKIVNADDLTAFFAGSPSGNGHEQQPPDIQSFIDTLHKQSHQVAILVQGMTTLQQIDDIRAKGFPVTEHALELLAASITTIAPELGLADAGNGGSVYTNGWSAESVGNTVVLQNFVLDAPTSDTVIAGRVALEYSRQGRQSSRKLTLEQAYSYLTHTLRSLSTNVLRETGGIATSQDAYSSLVMRSPRQFNLLRQQLRIVKHDLANPVGMLDSSLIMMSDYGADSVGQIGPLVEQYIITAAAVMKDAREAVCDEGESFNGARFSEVIAHGADIFLAQENIQVTAHPLARVLHPDGSASDEVVALSDLLVHFSRERLDSVVQNIFKNSVKGLYGMKKIPERNRSPKAVNISYRLNSVRNRLTVWFDDNGTGVPESMAQSGAFEEGKSEWIEGEGTGIGMWTLAQIAREYNVQLYPSNIMVPDPYAPDADRTVPVHLQRKEVQIPVGARIIAEFDVSYVSASSAVQSAA